MIKIAEMRDYILYHDMKYNEFLVVTPNRKITRYYKRLDKDISDYFDSKVKEINKESDDKHE